MKKSYHYAALIQQASCLVLVYSYSKSWLLTFAVLAGIEAIVNDIKAKME